MKSKKKAYGFYILHILQTNKQKPIHNPPLRPFYRPRRRRPQQMFTIRPLFVYMCFVNIPSLGGTVCTIMGNIFTTHTHIQMLCCVPRPTHTPHDTPHRPPTNIPTNVHFAISFFFCCCCCSSLVAIMHTLTHTHTRKQVTTIALSVLLFLHVCVRTYMTMMMGICYTLGVCLLNIVRCLVRVQFCFNQICNVNANIM